ncbi:hypothetical protein F8388_017480 [Cannabis sativa]|uniref:Ubiquitin-like protease family profile domain-containing protein n=2 Tax=Cannabis sativa TaxID=3483 RepID=A0A7J6F6P3_CANSA|nr:hypothetical protein F8388_017480 [Cannabis sativa]
MNLPYGSQWLRKPEVVSSSSLMNSGAGWKAQGLTPKFPNLEDPLMVLVEEIKNIAHDLEPYSNVAASGQKAGKGLIDEVADLDQKSITPNNEECVIIDSKRRRVGVNEDGTISSEDEAQDIDRETDSLKSSKHYILAAPHGNIALNLLIQQVLIHGLQKIEGSSYMAGKRKMKGGIEPVKKDVTPEPNDNAVAWRNFFNANYKALRAAEKGLTEKEATDKLKVQYKGFTDEEKDSPCAENGLRYHFGATKNVSGCTLFLQITLTSNPVILPNYYSDSEGRKSSDHFVSSINELKEYFSNELKSQLRSFSLKFMDKGEGVGGIDRELEEDAAAKTGKKAECSQAVEESPLKSPVRSKTNVVGLSEENVVESVSTPSLSATKSVEDEGAAHKTFDDEDFDIVEVASFWNKGKALVKSKKTQSENVPLIEDDFNDKAYEQFIESGRTVVGPFKTKEAIPRNQYGFYKFVFSNTLDPGYVLAKFRKFEVDRRCMASLRPLREVEGSVTVKYERDSRLPDQPRVWYMPTRISQKTLGSFNVKRIAKDREWSKLFNEDNFEKCVKMFVPVLTLQGAPHWFGAEVNMKSKAVSFLDSLHTAMHEKYCVEATKEMLSTLDLLFEENRSKNVTFVDFGIDRKDRGLPQQDNDRDCGVYVMKYMEVVANEEEVVDEFHPVEARLEIAARIITDEQNEIHYTQQSHPQEMLTKVWDGWSRVEGTTSKTATQICHPTEP